MKPRLGNSTIKFRCWFSHKQTNKLYVYITIGVLYSTKQSPYCIVQWCTVQYKTIILLYCTTVYCIVHKKSLVLYCTTVYCTIHNNHSVSGNRTIKMIHLS